MLVDAREGEQLKRLPEVYRRLRREYPATLVFIEASDEALAAAVQRDAAAASDGRRIFRCPRGYGCERSQMAPIRQLSDVVIDTTKFTVHELRQFIIDRFQKAGPKAAAGFAGELRLSIRLARGCGSGFRCALSAESALRAETAAVSAGRMHAWRNISGRSSRPGEFLRRIDGLLKYLIPHYISEGKSYLTIAFGCTGGRHRSVMMAEAVAKALGSGATRQNWNTGTWNARYREG